MKENQNGDGTVLNQVQNVYDGFGRLASQAQDHSTTVSSSTPTVGYGYDVNHADRLTSMTYPNGRALSYNYTGLDSTASRITSISDGNGTIQTYAYQGREVKRGRS